MAERRYISELTPNEVIDEVFLVHAKDMRKTRKGDFYIDATLGDRSGKIKARMWQANEGLFTGIPTEGFLRVKGRTQDYQGTLQLIIEACRPVSDEKVYMDDYLVTTELDVEVMWAELLDVMRGIKDEPLRLLIKKFTEDIPLVTEYKKAPAAMQMHHPYMGGLLEHTLNIVHLAKVILPLYPRLNADLLLAGIFLHDIGKTGELTSGMAIHYTERGQLVGHITMAAVWIQEKATLVAADMDEPFPIKTINLLQHIVLSHHGVHEYGSPKLPAIPEAFVLHYLDNLDAKMFMTFNAIDNDADLESEFTSYLRSLETQIYKHSDRL
jgi:3'-5' exoribonuclease